MIRFTVTVIPRAAGLKKKKDASRALLYKLDANSNSDATPQD